MTIEARERVTSEARKRVQRMTIPQRLAAHRAKVARQEAAAADLLRLVAAAVQPIELDGLDNLVAKAVATGTITTGRSAGIRDAIRARRRKFAKKREAIHAAEE